MLAAVGVVALLWLLFGCGPAGILGGADSAKLAVTTERFTLLAAVFLCALRFCGASNARPRPFSTQLGVCCCYDALFQPIALDDGGSFP